MSFQVLESTREQTFALQDYVHQRRSGFFDHGQSWLIYQGTAQTRHVELAGELTGWSSKRLRLQRGPGNVFYLPVKLPLDARLEYKFMVDGEWTLDPWNPLRIINGIGGINSALEMPGYRHESRLSGTQTPRRLDSLLLQGKAIPGARRLQIYQPHGLERGKRYPTIYFQDGSDYIERARLPELLDQLIARQEIEPVIAVCIDPRQRSNEYMLNADYGKLLIHEILPLIETNYPVLNTPKSRTLGGSSLGGLISSFIACQYRDSFGQVLGQSSSFQYGGDKMAALLAKSRDLKFYLSAGRFEGLMQANRNLVRSLAQTGYDYKYREHNEGHNWTHWSNHLAEGLIYLLGKK